VVCIEAGSRGWESIEFQEISQSAREYAGEGAVIELVIESPRTYLGQVRKTFAKSEVTHYFYDPRTGSQNFFPSLWQSLILGTMLTLMDIVPIGYGTNISERQWRLQLAIVTAKKGVCVCFMDASALSRIFPHRRIVGPSIMPFSLKTFERISTLRPESNSQQKKPASFVGSLYEPRTTTLSQIKEGLDKRGISFEVSTRNLGERKGPEESYWEALSGAEIQITTTSQLRLRGTDMSEVNQLVFRSTEALVCGAALVIEAVEGMGIHFQDGLHLYSFSTPDEAVAIVEKLLRDKAQLASVQLAGHQKIEEVIRSQLFWRTVDVALGAFSVLPSISEGDA
jgi:hypothetical protein